MPIGLENYAIEDLLSIMYPPGLLARKIEHANQINGVGSDLAYFVDLEHHRNMGPGGQGPRFPRPITYSFLFSFVDPFRPVDTEEVMSAQGMDVYDVLSDGRGLSELASLLLDNFKKHEINHLIGSTIHMVGFQAWIFFVLANTMRVDEFYWLSHLPLTVDSDSDEHEGNHEQQHDDACGGYQETQQPGDE